MIKLIPGRESGRERQFKCALDGLRGQDRLTGVVHGIAEEAILRGVPRCEHRLFIDRDVAQPFDVRDADPTRHQQTRREAVVGWQNVAVQAVDHEHIILERTTDRGSGGVHGR